MLRISHEWTDRERLTVLALIASQMASNTHKNGGWYQDGQVFRWAERIRFVTQYTAAFLEENRETILEGLPVQR